MNSRNEHNKSEPRFVLKQGSDLSFSQLVMGLLLFVQHFLILRDRHSRYLIKAAQAAAVHRLLIGIIEHPQLTVSVIIADISSRGHLFVFG